MEHEAELLNRARCFEKEALAEIYDTYSSALFRYAYRLLGSEDQAEECVAEVFSRFLQALSKGGGPEFHLKPYLYRIAHNWATDQFRRQPPPPLPLEPELISNNDINPSILAADNFQREQVRAMLRLLTPDQRQVILLKYFENFTNQETAEALDKPVGAVKSLQHRALAALERLLLKEEIIDEFVR